jgi:hypothetical protein
MANFTVTTNVSVVPNDGPTLAATLNGAGMNAKEVLDDVFADGALIDLAVLAGSIAQARGVLALAAGDGFLVNYDGLGPSTRYQKEHYARISDVSGGTLDLELTAKGAAQRIRVIVFGDPD